MKINKHVLMSIIAACMFNINMANAADNVSKKDVLDRTVTTTGKGEVFIPQTIATMQFTINETEKNAKDVQLDVRTKADQLVKALKQSNKTTSIQTISATVSPVMSYANNTTKVDGYTANYTVQVKSLIPDAGQLIDLAMNNGANSVNGPNMAASDKDIANAQLQAIKLATLDARDKANSALSVLGLKATGVKQVNVQPDNNRPMPVIARYSMMKASADAAPSTPVEGDKDEVTAEVSLVVSY